MILQQVGFMCLLCATFGKQLKFIAKNDVDFERKFADGDLQQLEQEWNSNFEHQVQNDFVEMVHVVFMNHLDVGYANYTINIINEYFTEYFPRAIDIARGLRSGGYVETFIYTTHAWLVSLYLDCPSNLILAEGIRLQCPSVKEKSKFIDAVSNGYITWHAGPMNLQIEMANEPWLFEAGLDLSAQLDQRFGITREFRVLSQRDVPGMTQVAIPSLVKKGIKGISVGVNNMTPPPAVPSLFIWQYANESVLATWHPGGYPDNPGNTPSKPEGLSRRDCVVIDKFPHALCFVFRTDNSGPPTDVAEVLGYYEILRAEFPNAQLKASRLDDFFSVAESLRASLPVVMSEIGDVWIQGCASDPRKNAEYRAVSRVMHMCLASGKCSMADPRVWNSSRFLIKLPEHTWGLADEPDLVHWSNEQFHKLRDVDKNFTLMADSWKEQRNYTYVAIEALDNHPVIADIKSELDRISPEWPNLLGFTEVADKLQVFSCDDSDVKQLQFGTDGSIVKLVTSTAGWSCSEDCHLGYFLYMSFNETDFINFGKVYNYKKNMSAGYYKRNLTDNAHPESKAWLASMVHLYRNKAGSCDFYVNVQMIDPQAVVFYGAPATMWIRYTVRPPGTRSVFGGGIDIDFQMFNKTSTRLPEALLYVFRPQHSRSWQMSKLGRLVDPLNVLLNGSQYQHAVDVYGIVFDASDEDRHGHESHLSRLRSPDVPVACPLVASDLPHVFPAPLQPLSSPITGFAFNIYNNIWDTNFIMWYPYSDNDADFRARFYIDV